MWVSCNVGSRYKLDKAKKCIFLRQSARRWTMMKIDKRVFKRMKHKSQSYFFVRSDFIVFSDLELSLLKKLWAFFLECFFVKFFNLLSNWFVFIMCSKYEYNYYYKGRFYYWKNQYSRQLASLALLIMKKQPLMTWE